jgi:hypothetical protein
MFIKFLFVDTRKKRSARKVHTKWREIKIVPLPRKPKQHVIEIIYGRDKFVGDFNMGKGKFVGHFNMGTL